MNSSGALVRGLTANQTATGTAVARECYLDSLRCVTSSSLVVSVFDNTSAAGKAIFTSLAMTAGVVYPVAGGGSLLHCALGVHVVVVSGTGSFDVMTGE